MGYGKRQISLLLAVVLLSQALALECQAAVKKTPRPLPKENNGVPVYFQTDYPHIRYGDGTMATSGCGPTSLSMVATYLTGYDYTPDRVANFFMGLENNVLRLEHGSNQLNLPWRKAEDFYDAYEALKEGDVAIAMMGPQSFFTSEQHFLVFAGVNEAGEILINDPMKPHYSNGFLDNALRDGFTIGEAIHGFCGAWVYDVSAMNTPEYRHEEPYVKPRYPWKALPQEERDHLAAYLWQTAGGRSQQCQQAIAEVMLNRTRAWGFSDTLAGVLQEENFPWEAAQGIKPTQVQYDALEQALLGPYLMPMDILYYGSEIPNGNIYAQYDGMTFCYHPLIKKIYMNEQNKKFQAETVPKWDPET